MTAWVALLSWPVVAAFFFRSWTVATATAATLIGGYLLLPEAINFDLPVLPAVGKGSIPILCALLFVWLASRDKTRATMMQPGWLPRDRVSLVLLALILLGAFGTATTNSESVSIGVGRLPAMRLYDGFSLALSAVMALIPFVLARKVMASPEAQRSLLIVLIGAAAGYALLALWEVRMSPQLNKQVYGFLSHSWQQHVRAGGFRPMVFVGHGLKLGIFFAMAAIAAAGLARFATGSQKSRFLAVALWLVFTIFMSKVLGAFMITMVLVPLVFMAPRHIQIPALISLAIIVLSYPALRNAQLVPTDRLVEIAERIDPARAESLEFRFDNEDILLDRARARPMFGWGGWGRNRVFDENGRDISTTDGRWVILFGQGGWVRYIGEMGLLCWCLIAICLRRDKIDGITIVLMFTLAANLIDLLPNSGMSPLTWLLAGALIGRLEYSASPEQEASATDPPSKTLRYTRQVTPVFRSSAPRRQRPAAKSPPKPARPLSIRGPGEIVRTRPAAPGTQKKPLYDR